jgi:hypothetical protein
LVLLGSLDHPPFLQSFTCSFGFGALSLWSAVASPWRLWDTQLSSEIGLSRLKRAIIEGMMLPASVVGEIGNSISGLVVACPWPDLVSHLYSHRATHWTDRRHGRNQATLH